MTGTLFVAGMFLQNKVVTLTTKSYKIKKPQQ